MKYFTKFLLVVLYVLFSVSCSDDDNRDTNQERTPGSLELIFSNWVEDQELVLFTGSYRNQSNESYSVNELNYIISNIVLIKENGEEFVYPVAESYFVINQENPNSKKIVLTDIPSGNFIKIRFGIGVDPLKYPIESGTANFIPTAEENGMLWNWSAGYKFIKFEGAFKDENEQKDFRIHVGSHGDNLDNYKQTVLDFPEKLKIDGNSVASLGISADIAKIFDSVHTFSLKEKSEVQIDAVNAPKIAANMKTMFSIEE